MSTSVNFLLASLLLLAACRSFDSSSETFFKIHNQAAPHGVSVIESLDFAALNDDYAVISDVVQGAEIVALGESIHTNGTFHKANAQISRYLIEKLGFRELALETPWQWAEVLAEYTRTCSSNLSPLEALRRIFPQFASAELLELYSWVREFNCSHQQDQVRVYGFDVQQIPLISTENRHDEAALEAFVNTSVPSLVSRLEDLRLCGPHQPIDSRARPTNDEELSKCHRFLSDLEPFVQGAARHSLWLRSSVIALYYSAGSSRFNSEDDFLVGNTWRDEGMARMIQHRKLSSSRTIIIAHNGHVFHDGQNVLPFANKTLGSFLDDAYGFRYRVISALAFKVTKATWWRNADQGGEDLYQPSDDSVEGTLNGLAVGNLFLNVKDNSVFQAGVKIEVNGRPDVEFQKHMDGIIFIPESLPATGVPGVTN